MTAAKRKKGKRLTPAEWAEAEKLWAIGAVTLDELERKHGIRANSFQKHFTRKGVKKGSKAEDHAKKVAAEVEKKASEEAAGDVLEFAKRIKETKETYYKLFDFLTKRSFAMVNEQLKPDPTTGVAKPLEAVANNLKTLKILTEMLQVHRQERWAILGLDKDSGLDGEDLPELLVGELSEEEARQVSEHKDPLGDLTAPDILTEDEEDDPESAAEDGS